MKKLMFVAAAAMAASLFADASIESDNIVGYSQSGLRLGGTMVAAQFIPIVGTSLSLDSIVPAGNVDLEGVEIQTLSAGGNTVNAYSWNTWMYESPCWVDGEGLPVSGVSFQAGEGLWVFGANANQALQTSGQVGAEDVIIRLRLGGTATGNGFPVAVDLNDILAVPYNSEVATDLEGVEIQTLSAGGDTVDAYSWNTWMYENPCWVDGEGLQLENVSFAAGQGLWVFGANTDQAIRIPAPEL